MPAKIRLTRHGKKKKPFYHIVIADSRAPRDGRFIERIGIYNPNTNPATIELKFDSALNWLQKGAQPTDTCRAILSYKGVLFKNHLLNGVKKGAFSEDEAEKRFQTWLKEKEGKIQAKQEKLLSAKNDAQKKVLEAEIKVNEARAQEIAKKQSDLAEEAALVEKKASEPEESEKENVTVEVAEEPKVEAKPEETIVEPKVEKPEAVEEVKAKAEPQAEVKQEVEKPEAVAEAKVEAEPQAELKEKKKPEAKKEVKTKSSGDKTEDSKKEDKTEGSK